MATASMDPADADPMFRGLRRRHPGVDVVLLPQPTPAEPRVPSLTQEQRASLAEDVERLVDDLVARLSREPAWTAAQRFGQWRTDEWDHVSYVTAAEVGELTGGGNIALLSAAGHVLLGLGWEAVPVPGDRPLIAARRAGGVTASVTVRPSTLVITCRSAWVGGVDDEAGR